MEKDPTRKDPLSAPNTWYTFCLLGVGFLYERLFWNFDPSCWVLFWKQEKLYYWQRAGERRREEGGGGGWGEEKGKTSSDKAYEIIEHPQISCAWSLLFKYFIQQMKTKFVSTKSYKLSSEVYNIDRCIWSIIDQNYFGACR